MSVESEILRIQRNIANAYAAVSEKGGDVPLQPNSANLAAAVAAIPTGGGIPPGGTTGQALVKASDADGDVVWGDVGGGPALQSLSITTPPAKTLYIVGDTFDPTGMETYASFSGDSGIYVDKPSLSFAPSGGLSEDDTEIEVSFSFGGKTVTADQPVTVENFEWWSPHMTGYDTPSPYTVEVSSDSENFPGWLSFDGNPNTYWNSNPDSTVYQYAIFGFGTPTTIKGIRIVTYTGIYPLYIPKQFSVYGSDDGENWIKIFTNDPNKELRPVAQENRDYIFDVPYKYSYFKLQAESANWSNDYLYIFDPADIQFFKEV